MLKLEFELLKKDAEITLLKKESELQIVIVEKSSEIAKLSRDLLQSKTASQTIFALNCPERFIADYSPIKFFLDNLM